MSTWGGGGGGGDIMSKSGDVQYMMHVEGYHDSYGGISSSGDVQYTGVFDINQRLLSISSPT